MEFAKATDNALASVPRYSPFAMMPVFLHCNTRMIVLGKGLRGLVLLGALIVFSAGVALASDDWQIIKVNGHDYLSIDNIARFYGFPTGVASASNRVGLEDATRSVEFTTDSREVIINGARNWLCFPVVEQDGQLLVSRMDLAKTLEPQLRPHLIPNLGRVETVVLDPGHGGYDKGTTSAHGCEKDFALDVARKIRPRLQARGLRVIMTRESDAFVPLELRARIANAARNSIFVSIHFNATDRDPNATGFEIYSLTPRGAPSTSDDSGEPSAADIAGSAVDAQSVELSACIYHSVLGHIQEFDRGIKRARFAVLRLTKVPAVLMEGGFLTERGESKLIEDKAWRTKLAAAMSIGIENYAALADNKQRPMLLAEYRRQGSDMQVVDDPSPTPAPTATPSLLSAVIVP